MVGTRKEPKGIEVLEDLLLFDLIMLAWGYDLTFGCSSVEHILGSRNNSYKITKITKTDI